MKRKYIKYYGVAPDGTVSATIKMNPKDIEGIMEDYEYAGIICACEDCEELMRFSPVEDCFICDECDNFIYRWALPDF